MVACCNGRAQHCFNPNEQVRTLLPHGPPQPADNGANAPRPSPAHRASISTSKSTHSCRMAATSRPSPPPSPASAESAAATVRASMSCSGHGDSGHRDSGHRDSGHKEVEASNGATSNGQVQLYPAEPCAAALQAVWQVITHARALLPLTATAAHHSTRPLTATAARCSTERLQCTHLRHALSLAQVKPSVEESAQRELSGPR